jgi:2-methylcitrate dehydratase
MNTQYDALFETIADYILKPPRFSPLAYETAQWCLMDALGCAALAMTFPAATKMLGPIVPGVICEKGVHVMGTEPVLDPVKAAFDYGLLIRWLDYNDTWLAKEWGHPSDNLGAILATIDYLQHQEQKTFLIKDILDAMIMAYEIQGMIAIDNAFNAVGLDHVILVKLASAAVCMKLLGGQRQQILDVLTQVFVDGHSLRTYRHAPNTGSRKSWAAGDATSRALWLCLMTLKGERGYPSALTARPWGFQDALNRGNPVVLTNPLSCYVMENILFKVQYPAEFHAQTAVEAAIRLHPEVKDRLDEISRISIETQAAGHRIIDKTGPLHNPADRDHCLQYMVAVGLLMGDLTADSYEDDFAKDPRIDVLRGKMEVTENQGFTADYFDPNKRAIPNRISIEFKEGGKLTPIQVDYPLGHRSRRNEAKKAIFDKALHNFSQYYPEKKSSDLISFFNDSSLPLTQVPVLFNIFAK